MVQSPWAWWLGSITNENSQKFVAHQRQDIRNTGVRGLMRGPQTMKMDGSFTYDLEMKETRESAEAAWSQHAQQDQAYCEKKRLRIGRIEDQPTPFCSSNSAVFFFGPRVTVSDLLVGETRAKRAQKAPRRRLCFASADASKSLEPPGQFEPRTRCVAPFPSDLHDFQ